MKEYHTFVFTVAHDVIKVDDDIHTTVPKRHAIVITISDEDAKRADAVNLAFYKAREEYKKRLLEEQMYHK